jgi:hypothetical protein
MADTKQNSQVKPQGESVELHPDEYRNDLNSNAMAGQNIGAVGRHPEKGSRTAHDIKGLHARFSDWSDAELKQIPVLPAGSRLEHNATYIDLAAARPTEFTATADMAAGSGQCIVPKTEVPYQIWNRLLGITNPARTGGTTGATN